MDSAQDHISIFNENSRRLPVLLVVATLGLAPVYLFGSGGPQPVDLPILCVVIYVFLTLNYFEVRWLSPIFMPFAAFICWALSINFYYFMVFYESGFLKSSSHLIYSMFLFFAFTIIFFRILGDKKFKLYLYSGVFLGMLTPLFARGMPSLEFMARQALSFNDPNQLADFSLLMMAAILILNHYYRKRFSESRGSTAVPFISCIVFMLGHLYIILSASRAGLGGLFILDGVMFWQMKHRLAVILIPVILGVSIVTAVQLYNGSPGRYFSQLENVLIGSRMNIDILAKLEKRTSGRLNIEDFSFIFGIGKCSGCPGKKAGKNTFDIQREAHNTLADIVYSYGIIGLCLFSIFLFQYFKAAFRTLFFIPIFIAFIPVNISQNFIRFRSAWIFYALVYAVATWKMAQRNRKEDPSYPELTASQIKMQPLDRQERPASDSGN